MYMSRIHTDSKYLSDKLVQVCLLSFQKCTPQIKMFGAAADLGTKQAKSGTIWVEVGNKIMQPRIQLCKPCFQIQFSKGDRSEYTILSYIIIV